MTAASKACCCDKHAGRNNWCPDCPIHGGHVPMSDQPTATAPEYEVRISIRGDELHLPFRVFAGRDYATGECLDAVAERIAHDVVNGRYALGEDATVVIREVPGDDCMGDDEPIDLATATVYAP